MATDFRRTVEITFESALKTLKEIEQANIENSGLVEHFKQLKRSTIKRKQRYGVKAEWITKPLLRFGALYKGLYAIIEGTGTTRELKLGSTAPYAIYHITGTKRMPARNFTLYNHDLFNRFFEKYIPEITAVATEEALEFIQKMVKE